MSGRHARSNALTLIRPRRQPEPRVHVGDRIRVPGRQRAAVVVEVQNGNGAPPYVVVWSDNGQRALFYPPADAQIQHAG